MAATAGHTEPSGLQNVSALLDTLNTCLSSTGASLPSAKRESPSDVSIEPPKEGISLLDTKSDLLLSYLQNLVFLTILQLREISSNGDEDAEANESLREDAVKQLVELRVYLDRGVRPIEGRLKYQVDKVIKAAEDAERAERGSQPTKKNKTRKPHESGSEDDSSESEGDSDQEDEDDEGVDEMAYRPNVSSFSKKIEPQAKPEISAKNASNDGIYRPPKIMPTSLPTTERRERGDRRPRRSNVIDEFVSAEMSSAPMAEASIGSTIRFGGRETKSKRDREHEAERAAYEETNFVRLPEETKKDRYKRLGGRRQGTFGGEDWQGLTEGADRIAKLTRRAKGSGGALEKSRKRKVNEGGPRGDGADVGQIFEKRRKKVDSWKR